MKEAWCDAFHNEERDDYYGDPDYGQDMLEYEEYEAYLAQRELEEANQNDNSDADLLAESAENDNKLASALQEWLQFRNRWDRIRSGI